MEQATRWWQDGVLGWSSWRALRSRYGQITASLPTRGSGGLDCGDWKLDDEPELDGGLGVREPRPRPRPTLSSAVALELPPEEIRDLDARGRYA